MPDRREFELYLVRLVPHALRDDFVTVGVVLVEPGGTFADVRLSRDWKRIACFAPDFEMEVLNRLESDLRAGLKGIKRREDLLAFLDAGFGPVFDVGTVKGVLAADPVAEMRVLEAAYLAPIQASEKTRSSGRLGILNAMQTAFEDAGVLGFLQRDMKMTQFTGENDPFRVDFGIRAGKTLKMFQALALSLSRDPAVTLAYRFTRIRAGLREQNEEALMTAVISSEAARARGEVALGIAMLRANDVMVRPVEEMAEIAGEVK